MSFRVALAQCNSLIHQPYTNAAHICSLIKDMPAVDLTVLPELALIGYMPYDLSYPNALLKEQTKALRLLADTIEGDRALLVGGICPHDRPVGRWGTLFYNGAYLVTKNNYRFVQAKQSLPFYDVFYEPRYFERGESLNIIELNGVRIAIFICEDMWNTDSATSPLAQLKKQDTVDLVCCLSASPYQLDKNLMRIYHAARVVESAGLPLVFVNAVGGQDEIVFDGSSFFMDSAQKLICLSSCKEECQIAELTGAGSFLQNTNPFKKSRPITAAQYIPHPSFSSKSMTLDLRDYEYNSDVYFAFGNRDWDALLEVLEFGVRDFCSKLGFSKIHLGISGGIDSALVAVIATRALGSDAVRAILLPSQYTSELSYTCASELISRLGIAATTMHIDSLSKMAIDKLGPAIAAHQNSEKPQLHSITRQNLQARMRALLLMAFSNETSSLLLTTGNKSELSVGYATLYGDMCGGLNPIGDLFKTEVFELSKHVADKYGTIPLEIITREPSAELAESQKDSDSLPPYDLLDKILYEIIINGLHKDEILALDCFPSEIVEQIWSLFHISEFKRYQAPPIIKVSSSAFGKGRIVPLTGRY